MTTIANLIEVLKVNLPDVLKTQKVSCGKPRDLMTAKLLPHIKAMTEAEKDEALAIAVWNLHSLECEIDVTENEVDATSKKNNSMARMIENYSSGIVTTESENKELAATIVTTESEKIKLVAAIKKRNNEAKQSRLNNKTS